MTDEPDKNALHFFNAHIDLLDHTPIEHTRWNGPITALLLQFLQAPEDNAFVVRETVSYVWQVITSIMIRHVRFFRCSYAEEIATMCRYHMGGLLLFLYQKRSSIGIRTLLPHTYPHLDRPHAPTDLLLVLPAGSIS